MPDFDGVSLPATPPSGRWLAFDFGTRRIGVATGFRETGTVQPLTVLHSRDGVPDWAAILQLQQTWQPVACVVGLPLRAHDDSPQLSTRQAHKFGRRLAGRTGLPVYFTPEQYTSTEAAHHLDTGSDRAPLDAVSAAIILAQFFHVLEASQGI